jgi:hypothetical protein
LRIITDIRLGQICIKYVPFSTDLVVTKSLNLISGFHDSIWVETSWQDIRSELLTFIVDVKFPRDYEISAIKWGSANAAHIFLSSSLSAALWAAAKKTESSSMGLLFSTLASLKFSDEKPISA